MWFEDWFDTELYDRLYANRDRRDASRLIDLIARECPPERYPKALDLGCGRGRHAIELAIRGYRMTGLDLSASALAIAEREASAQGVEVRWVRQDMRRPLPETFDLVVNLFTSFGYFDDEDEDVKVIAAVAEMLRPGGRFVVDFLNAELVAASLVADETRELGETSELGRAKVRIRRGIEGDRVVKRMDFESASGTSLGSYREQVRLHRREWFMAKMASLGLQCVLEAGDNEGAPFDPLTSPRLILFFEKTGRGV